MKTQKKLLYTLAAWLIVLLLLELGLRTYEIATGATQAQKAAASGRIARFIPHPYAAYAANPAHPEHNAQGFRAPHDLQYAPDPGALTIACMGGSSTYGTRVPPEDCYPRQLEVVLSSTMNRPVRVINAGLGGYNTPNLISMLSLRVVPLRPQVVLFYCGWNDVRCRLLFADLQTDYSNAQKSWEMTDLPWWRHVRVFDKTAQLLKRPWSPNIHQIVWRPQAGDLTENWRKSSGEPFRANLVTLAAIARAHGATPVFITQATDFAHHPLKADNEAFRQAMKEYTAILTEVARRQSVPLIDVRGAMTDQKECFADVLHMNKTGNRKRAEIIAAYLLEHELITR